MQTKFTKQQLPALDKTDVGLSNVDNTSDINKPISTATQSALNAKQDTLGFTPENVANKNAISGYAGLDVAGKINPTQLPALAITDTFVVASQVAQVALTAEVGDVAVRTDINKSYILRTSPASTFANWQELLTPTDAVSSIFSRTGVVTAQSGDYTASQVTNTPAGSITAVTVQSAINELDGDITALPSATQTLSNKTLTHATNIIRRVTTIASSATLTPTGDSDFNYFSVTALAVNATISAPSGTPAEGHSVVIRIKDNGTSRTLAFDTIFRAIGVTLPTTTVANKTMYLGAMYNATDSKWDINSYNVEI